MPPSRTNSSFFRVGKPQREGLLCRDALGVGVRDPISGVPGDVEGGLFHGLAGLGVGQDRCPDFGVLRGLDALGMPEEQGLPGQLERAGAAWKCGSALGDGRLSR